MLSVSPGVASVSSLVTLDNGIQDGGGPRRCSVGGRKWAFGPRRHRRHRTLYANKFLTLSQPTFVSTNSYVHSLVRHAYRLHVYVCVRARIYVCMWSPRARNVHGAGTKSKRRIFAIARYRAIKFTRAINNCSKYGASFLLECSSPAVYLPIKLSEF